MSVMPYPASENYERDDLSLPERPRRRWWTRGTGVVLALLLGAIGFYAGVRVEKGQLSSSPAATRAAGTGAGFAARTGAAAGGAAGGFAARFGGAGGAGRATFGTVSTVDGKTMYVTDATGNTVKVTFNSATKVTKNESASAKAIHPGDTVIVQGLKGAGGEVAAASVTDSGARAGSSGSGTGGGSGSGGSSSNSASSAVNSLFGGGG